METELYRRKVWPDGSVSHIKATPAEIAEAAGEYNLIAQCLLSNTEIADLRAQLAAANERAEKAEGQRDALTDAIKDVLQDFDETDFDDFEHTKPLHRCSYCRSNFHWSPTGSPVEHKKRCVAGKLEAALAVINATKGEE